MMHSDAVNNMGAWLKLVGLGDEKGTGVTGGEVRSVSTETHGPTAISRDEPQVATGGYGDRPSRAWLRTTHQFVLLKSHSGAISPASFALARDLVIKAEDGAPGRAGERDQLMVRGIALRAPRKATAYLDLICAAGSASPYLELRTTQERLERHLWLFGGAPIIVQIKAEVVPLDEADADPLDDRFYERVRLAIGW